MKSCSLVLIEHSTPYNETRTAHVSRGPPTSLSIGLVLAVALLRFYVQDVFVPMTNSRCAIVEFNFQCRALRGLFAQQIAARMSQEEHGCITYLPTLKRR